MSDKYEGLKVEYRQLLDAFEKSEKIRREQKILIQQLKREALKLKAAGFKEHLEEERKAPATTSVSPAAAPIISLEVVTKDKAFKKRARSRSKAASTSSEDDAPKRETRR